MDGRSFRVYCKGVFKEGERERDWCGTNASSSANYRLRCAFSPVIARNFMELAVRIASSRTDILNPGRFPQASIFDVQGYCGP